MKQKTLKQQLIENKKIVDSCKLVGIKETITLFFKKIDENKNNWVGWNQQFIQDWKEIKI